MGDRIIAFAGKLLVHAVKALLVCWQRMLRLGLSVGALSGLVALVFGTYVTHNFPPAPLTWVVALFFGFALGYAAAMTVLADEMLLGIFEAIGVLEGDVRAGMRAAGVAAEREAGEAGRGIMRFLGHSRATPVNSAPTADRASPSSPLMTVSAMERHEPGHEQADETLAAVAATESFLNTAPRPAVNARPVRADQLPRIGWASEDAEMRRAPQAVIATAPAPMPVPALAEMPPLPVRTLRSQPRAEAAPDAGTPPAAEAVAENERARTEAVPAPRVAEDSGQVGRLQLDDSSEGATEVVTPRPVPVLTRDASGDTLDSSGAKVTAAADGDVTPTLERPHPAVTRPLETEREEHGIWARISQALIGNTTVPLRQADTAGSADGRSETSQP